MRSWPRLNFNTTDLERGMLSHVFASDGQSSAIASFCMADGLLSVLPSSFELMLKAAFPLPRQENGMLVL